jgi:glycerol uptake facilitator-like aquaporin
MLLNDRRRALIGEALGTAFLVIAVVGSGIAAQSLTTDPGLQLLINAFATAGALVALIGAFSAISPARFNPVVTLIAFVERRINAGDAILETVAQTIGACTGTITANIMFGIGAIRLSTQNRSGGRLVFAEIIATIGLLLVIHLTARRAGPTTIAVGVAGYIAGAYFFTSSTSFANPAVTIARTLTNTFTGIAPSSAIRFVAAQAIGALLAVALLHVFTPDDLPPRRIPPSAIEPTEPSPHTD